MVQENVRPGRFLPRMRLRLTLLQGLALWTGFCILFGAVCAKLGWQLGEGAFSALLSLEGSRFCLPWYESGLWYLFSWLVFLGLSFFAGFWMVGQPFTLAALSCKGIGLGSLFCSFCLSEGWSGAGKALLLVLPSGLAGLFALLISAKESLRFGTMLALSLREDRPRLGLSHFRLYSLKHAATLLILAIGALLDQMALLCFRTFFA